jgi:hypothetical protein
MSRRWVLIPALAAILVAAVLGARFLTQNRDLVASTPSPRPVFTVNYLQLRPGSELCIADVTIPADAHRLRMQVRTYGRPGPALNVTLAAGSYRQRVAVPGGYADQTTLDAPMAPPRADSLGRVCVTQDSGQAIAFASSVEERTESRPQSTIDGSAVGPDSYLAFYEGRTGGALAETPAIVERMGAFKPGVVGPWLLWPLLALTVIGVPGGVVWAVLRAVRA